MSSKSRKQSARKKSRADRPHETETAGVTENLAARAKAAALPDREGLIGEEVIHVPKGRNRFQYAVMIGLLVFLTIVFLVPGAILSAFSAGSDAPDVLAFDLPHGGRQVLSATEYQERRNSISVPLEIFPLLRFFVGVEGRNPTDQELARLIVLEDLAGEAGLIVTDAELVEFLQSVQIERDVWRQFTARYGGPGKVEPSLRRVLAIRRYLELMGQVARIPDVSAIEERWNEEHVELAYDYVAVETASFTDQAMAAAPAEEELQTWFDERPEFERNRFMDPMKYGASLALYRNAESTPATGLLERYPDTSGEQADSRAEDYYNQVVFTRFRRPEPEPEPEPEPKPEPEPEPAPEPAGDAALAEVVEDPAETVEEPPPSPYLSLDEVRDRCLSEAPVFFALGAWRADLQERLLAGEDVDVIAEAAELGLDLIRTEEPRSLTELRDDEAIGGTYVAGMISRTEPGQVGITVVAEDSGLVVVLVDERVEPALPPLTEIRDEVLESWAEDESAELALASLTALWDGFEEFESEHDVEDAAQDDEDAEQDDHVHRRVDEQAFKAAIEAAGFEVQRRPWLDRTGPVEDPDADKPGHLFLAQHREYADLADGEVPEPALDRLGATAYLVFVVGRREIDIARMTPQVYQSYKLASAAEPSAAVREYLTGTELDDRYGIQWLNASAEEQEPTEQEPQEAASEQ